ncbi:MAG: anaerobic ribonucleoside-triphosphate reductase activating protein [Candidatus Bathyarchaeota archaeon]|nr:anaerobic ribonucleoside-triphosphate reductase activating protein [Candidatus Bathyarchaeota archaeon]
MGLRKLSTVDYPGKLSIDLSVAGCNYRCPFCPNKELIYDYIPMEKINQEELVKILRPRLGFLDGVSLSGGEPTLHRDLVDLLKELRFHGSEIKIKTNASRPKVIRILLDKHLVDYFSVFIPAPISKYKKIINYNIDINVVEETIQMIRKSGLDHEFRVKPVPGLIEEAEVTEIANYLIGAPRFVLERFDPDKSMDELYRDVEPFSDAELEEMRLKVAPYFNETSIQ